MPAVPKKPVPEEKVPVPVSRKVAAPPAKGIQVLLKVEKASKYQISVCIILTIYLVNQILVSPDLIINEKELCLLPCKRMQKVTENSHIPAFFAFSGHYLISLITVAA